MELLAPAGSVEALVAAVQSGADAIYFGANKFSARSSAKNFSIESMKEWIDYCHIRGVSLHLAANTLIKENEILEYLDYIKKANELGVDAVIIQDLGMASVVKKICPDLEIHASTQMTCASLKTAKKLEEIGFSRIVLARELDKDSIKKIADGTKAQIEVFVHGAICMCYSGQCQMSSMIGGRSGNRGMCAQPCRLSYKFLHNGKNVNNGYLLSPKDMCLVDCLSELRNIGVSSLKIEGRLKRAEYVSSVLGVYRDCLDNNKKSSDTQKQELLNAFNRSGFTDGYFRAKLGQGMMTYENPSNISENTFSIDAIKRCDINKEYKKIAINIDAKLNCYEPFVITITDTNNNEVTFISDAIGEIANNKPITKKRLEEQLSKLGNTPFTVNCIKTDIDENVIIPISKINDARREAIRLLENKRKEVKKRRINKNNIKIENKTIDTPAFSAKVRNINQARVCIENGINIIYAPFDVIDKLQNENRNLKLIQVLPCIDREEKNNNKIISDSVLVSSLGQTANNDEKKYYADFRLNVTNSYSLEYLKNFECVTLSPELTIKEIEDIKKPCNTEIIVYGKIPLMVFENCPVKAHKMCDNGISQNKLIDRMNEHFELVCGEGCFCELLNSKPIFMADKLVYLKKCNVKYMRLDFTTEDENECAYIINIYKNALYDNKITKMEENTFTRGHFYKKVN